MLQLQAGLTGIWTLSAPALLQQGERLLTLTLPVLPDLLQPVFPLRQRLLLLTNCRLRADQAPAQIIQTLLALFKAALPAALQRFPCLS